jgi:colanic acid/amylovoran biosynthesis glycosyltransferase
VQVVLTTYGFPTYQQSFLENYVHALTELGADVCVVASASSDHVSAPPSRAGDTGSIEIVEAPWSNARGKKIVTLFEALGGGLRHHRRELVALIESLRRRHGVGRAFLRQLYVLAPVLSRPVDVVHVGWLTAATHSTDLLAVLDAPIVVSCHGSDLHIDPLLGDRYRTPLAEVFGRVDLVHCVSHELAREAVALGLDPAKAFVCSWGVDTHTFRPAPDARATGSRRADGDGALRVVSVSRLHWVKGYEFALQALALVRRSGVEIDYTIIGQADDKGLLSVLATARDLGLESHVHVRGTRSPAEIVETLRSADVFLLASLSEGLSTATLEAMAVGLPVVVTDVGGMREAVTDGVDGFVVPPRDPAAIAAALVELAGDRELRRSMGEQGRRRAVADFDSRSCAQALLAEYARLVAERSS